METQFCRICNKEKTLEEYPDKWSQNKTGYRIIGKRNECRDCSNNRRKQSYERDWRKGILMNVKQRVRLLKIPFNLTLEDIIIPEYCPILNVKLQRGTKKDYRYSPTVDRLDNNKGYIKGNIRIISKQAKKMKNNPTKEELIQFSKNIMTYLNDDIV